MGPCLKDLGLGWTESKWRRTPFARSSDSLSTRNTKDNCDNISHVPLVQSLLDQQCLVVLVRRRPAAREFGESEPCSQLTCSPVGSAGRCTAITSSGRFSAGVAARCRLVVKYGSNNGCASVRGRSMPHHSGDGVSKVPGVEMSSSGVVSGIRVITRWTPKGKWKARVFVGDIICMRPFSSTFGDLNSNLSLMGSYASADTIPAHFSYATSVCNYWRLPHSWALRSEFQLGVSGVAAPVVVSFQSAPSSIAATAALFASPSASCIAGPWQSTERRD
eukprot:SAG31_NODE_82_length_27046_cov_45.857275_17_plen_276_part_00